MHPRYIVHARRLQDAEAEVLVSMLKEFWAARCTEVDAAFGGPVAQTSSDTNCGSPNGEPAASSTDAKEQSSKPTGEGVAADGGHNRAQAQELSQQGDDGAAGAAVDVVEGDSGENPASQGRCSIVRIHGQHVPCSSVTERALVFHAIPHACLLKRTVLVVVL